MICLLILVLYIIRNHIPFSNIKILTNSSGVDIHLAVKSIHNMDVRYHIIKIPDVTLQVEYLGSVWSIIGFPNQVKISTYLPVRIYNFHYGPS